MSAMSDAMPPVLLSIATFPLRWGDMDALGHLNNTIYFRYFEQARVEWLYANGWPVDRAASEGALLLTTNCHFRAQVVYPGDIRIETYITKVGKSSFTFSQRMSRADAPDVIVAESVSVNVWCDYAANTSRPIPDRLRLLLTGALS